MLVLTKTYLCLSYKKNTVMFEENFRSNQRSAKAIKAGKFRKISLNSHATFKAAFAEWKYGN